MFFSGTHFFAGGCGGIFYAADHEVVLESPNYPRHYPLNTSCTWNLIGTSKSDILLTISDLHLEESSGCQNGSLQVYVDDNLVATLCGNQAGNQTFKARKRITVVFRTDDSRQYRGFRASFKSGKFL